MFGDDYDQLRDGSDRNSYHCGGLQWQDKSMRQSGMCELVGESVSFFGRKCELMGERR